RPVAQPAAARELGRVVQGVRPARAELHLPGADDERPAEQLLPAGESQPGGRVAGIGRRVSGVGRGRGSPRPRPTVTGRGAVRGERATVPDRAPAPKRGTRGPTGTRASAARAGPPG